LSKLRKIFICSNCGTQSSKWEGKCHSCNEWNTLVEEVLVRTQKDNRQILANSYKDQNVETKAIKLQEISSSDSPRIKIKDTELNTVLGGGIVQGSVILIGGHPGIGKSTLLLQLALQNDLSTLYISGEESGEQIKIRSERIEGTNENCYLFTETDVDKIIKESKKIKPDILIIDSVQTLSSPLLDSTPGSVSQIRECTAVLQNFAKSSGIPVFIIGHITKEGNIAGPKLLEHMVDVVLQFEGDNNHIYRILRTIKNRFGSTEEIGIYRMQSDGLNIVSNPSEILLSQHDELLSGSSIAATLEGLRPLFIEVQALVSPAVYGNPQRSATGFDGRRLAMLLAILEKRSGFPLGLQDVFLNIAGGLKITDPAMDLGIMSAIISSFEDKALPKDMVMAAEVGLSGEVRAISRLESRIKEAERLGFSSILVSHYNLKSIKTSEFDIDIIGIKKINELIDLIFSD